MIDKEKAKQIRHPKEAAEAKAVSKNIDNTNEIDQDNQDIEDNDEEGPDLYFMPTSPSELFLAFALCFPTMLFILYLVLVLYRCVCSRNYAGKSLFTRWAIRTSKFEDPHTQP